MAYTKWTPERDEIVRKLWPTHGGDWDGWSEALGMKVTPNSVRTHASQIGCANRKPGKRPYSAEEERELLAIAKWFGKRHKRPLGSIARKLEALNRRSGVADRFNREIMDVSCADTTSGRNETEPAGTKRNQPQSL